MMKDMFKKWFEGLFMPQQTFKNIKREANIKDAVLYIVVASLIYGVIVGLAIAFIPGLGMWSGMSLYIELFGMYGITPTVFGLMIPLIAVAGGIAGLFVNVAIFHLFAYLFGGRAPGGFTRQLYLRAVFTAALSLISILILIPIAGLVLVSLISIYALYPTIVAIKEAYDFTWGKAILTFIVPVILLTVVYLIGFFAYFSAMLM
ncbi:hypothetical protein GF371_04170 [Candidatus Woesearchaeota archaeon]|nr:hypothetical protein [Candidatus Woesearchaeota archaeon]